MPEPNVPTSSPDASPRSRPQGGGMFAEPTALAERSFPVAAVALAVVAVLLLLAALVVFGRHKVAGSGAASAAYGPNLHLDGVEMSESTSFSGSKETYADGRITNSGTATVTGVTVQVAFPSDSGAAQVETVPLNLIRMRQPEIDTEPVSAEPLAPGATKEFRLIFDDVKPEWNQQTPEIRVAAVSTK